MEVKIFLKKMWDFQRHLRNLLPYPEPMQHQQQQLQSRMSGDPKMNTGI
jgi:hypothetical protein